MKLGTGKEIFNFRNNNLGGKTILYGCYPHIVKNKLYWQSRCEGQLASIEYANITGEAVDVPENNFALTKSLAAQNFRVFYDSNPNTPENERWKAIGGYHAGRGSIKVKNPTKSQIYGSPLHAELRGCRLSETSEIEVIQDVVWSEEMKLLFPDDYSHPRHANGFYIFKSPDGIKWDLFHPLPVFSTFTECETGYTVGSDNMPSIFYDHATEEYLTYLRCNIKLGVRNVLCSRSKDLITWSAPQLIKKSPKFDYEHENLYYMGAYPLANSSKYVSFTPHFKNDILTKDGSRRKYYDAKTLLMISDDGVQWDVVSEIFLDQSGGHLNQPHVVSFEDDGDVYSLYVHEGFMSHQNRLVKYEVSKREFNSVVGVE